MDCSYYNIGTSLHLLWSLRIILLDNDAKILNTQKFKITLVININLFLN